MAPQVVKIADRSSGAESRILVSLGFNCFSWRPAIGGDSREMLWAEPGFENGDKRPSGSGNPLLFPFPGRIANAIYSFNGREYQLEPSDAFGNAIHGFVFNRPWRVVDQSESRVVGEFQASVDDRSILEHWPADFRIRVSYEVRGPALISEIQYENTGNGPLPCGFATHAYFRLPLTQHANVEDTIVTVPVDKYWPLERMIPTGDIRDVDKDQRLASGLPLGAHQFDTAFTNVRPAADGKVHTQLRDPASGRTLTQTFPADFTQCVVYTPGHREAICIEPYTCVPDAIHLAAAGHKTGLQILEPGESFATIIRLETK
jgi:aldose 1-epimerase